MEEKILSFSELNEIEKEMAIERYKNDRIQQAQEENYDYGYDKYTEQDWEQSAAYYSYLVQYENNELILVACLF